MHLGKGLVAVNKGVTGVISAKVNYLETHLGCHSSCSYASGNPKTSKVSESMTPTLWVHPSTLWVPHEAVVIRVSEGAP